MSTSALHEYSAPLTDYGSGAPQADSPPEPPGSPALAVDDRPTDDLPTDDLPVVYDDDANASMVWQAAALFALVFVSDLTMPLGVAGGVPYVAPVLLGLWSNNTKHAPVSVALATVLTVLGWGLSPPGEGPPMYVVANRVLAFMAIWACGFAVHARVRARALLEDERRSKERFQAMAEEALREKETAEKLGRMAALVAHEVKNPLAGISGALQIIAARTPGDSPEQRIIRATVSRLQGLGTAVDDLVGFARSSPPVLHRSRLADVMHRVAEPLAEDAERQGIDLDVRGGDFEADVDERLLASALRGLINNAIQAMGDKEGTITVRATLDRQHARLCVVDQGPGIPASLRRQVLQPFFTTRKDGTGLGLPAARRTAEAHGGTLSVHDADGGGAHICMEFPVESSLPLATHQAK